MNKFSTRQFRNKGEARLVTPFTSDLTVSFYVKINLFKLATPCFVHTLVVFADNGHSGRNS